MSEIPAPLKSIANYMRIAGDHDTRDVAIAYYARLYSVQKGMGLGLKDKESKLYLLKLMDHLEAMKDKNKDVELILNETAGSAHVENYAMDLFVKADAKDKACDFTPVTMKLFATVGFILDIIDVFGEINEEMGKIRKYCKWKAVNIGQCLKRNEVPLPGMGNNADQDIQMPGIPAASRGGGAPSSSSSQPAAPQHPQPPSPTSALAPQPASSVAAPTSNPAAASAITATSNISREEVTTTSGEFAKLSMEDFAKCEKMCKFAVSAIQYQDSKAAVSYLTKCISMLKFGHE